ncbi:hypothetical protein, partial [Pseudomonas zeae]|uniref:hypothetical protein n=1 Tax=Pseudomonas zeae TaxID=2745510 RepID=UPI003D047BC4
AGIDGWRQKAIARPEDAAALLADTGSAGWRDPFAWLPADKQPADGAWNVVHASFARPAAGTGRAALFVGDITPGQQVYLNGKAQTPRREDG